MGNTRVIEMFRQLTQAGGLLDFGPERSRLLVRVQRALAAGRPVTAEEIARYVADLGLTLEEADIFLQTVTERDEDDNIVGAMGLSLNETPHHVALDGTRFSAWCAGDTLILPAVLDRTAIVESASPVSGLPIRLRVSPERVEEVSPAGAVVSMVVVDPKPADVSSVEAMWGTFCQQIFFFASREEAEQWAAGRANIEIMPVDEVNDLVRQFSSRLLAYAA